MDINFTLVNLWLQSALFVGYIYWENSYLAKKKKYKEFSYSYNKTLFKEQFLGKNNFIYLVFYILFRPSDYIMRRNREMQSSWSRFCKLLTNSKQLLAFPTQGHARIKMSISVVRVDCVATAPPCPCPRIILRSHSWLRNIKRMCSCSFSSSHRTFQNTTPKKTFWM